MKKLYGVVAAVAVVAFTVPAYAVIDLSGLDPVAEVAPVIAYGALIVTALAGFFGLRKAIKLTNKS
jgi:hypothetical protein